MKLRNRLPDRRARAQGVAVEDAQPANAASKPGVGTIWPIVWPSLCFFFGAVTLLLIIARSVGTMSADLSGNGDSSAHFVNGKSEPRWGEAIFDAEQQRRMGLGELVDIEDPGYFSDEDVNDAESDRDSSLR